MKVNIDSLFIKKIVENKTYNNLDVSFFVLDKMTLDINGNGKKDDIVFENCVGWEESEPGDFRQLQISLDDKSIVIFKNFGGWIKVPENLNKFSDNNYFIPVNMGFKNPVLVFFSYSYASESGYLTLYTYLDNEVRPIFNQKVWLRDVETIDNRLQRLVVDYNYGDEPYGIWVENNELKFEKL